MTLWLGTATPAWLWGPGLPGVPLFVSAVRMRMMRTFGYAPGRRWALDSGGFSEIAAYGRWRTGPAAYAREVRLWREEVGSLEWAAVQDWMCEPHMLGKTGLTVADHQRLTVKSYTDLAGIAPDLPWVPVVQGWEPDDYRRHVDLYAAAGVDLGRLPLVGIGSVCRRQSTAAGAAVVRAVTAAGVSRVHGFGVKTSGLTGPNALSGVLTSADSMAWSFSARKKWNAGGRQMCGGGHVGRRGRPNACNHCKAWAGAWYASISAAC